MAAVERLDEGGYAQAAVDGGRVLSRECSLSGGFLSLSGTVRSSCYDRSHEAYITPDLLDGSVASAQCADCAEFEDANADYFWTHECECRHGASVLLAFLEDPHSFAGCPEGLQLLAV